MAMTVSHVKSNTIADWSGTVTVGNSTGGSTTMAASDMVRPSDWNSNHVISEQTVGYFEPFIPANTNSNLSAPGIGTWYFHPFALPLGIGSGQINMLNACAAGWLNGTLHTRSITGINTRYDTFMNRIAIYKLGSGASTTRLESVWTGSCDIMATWARTFTSSTATSHYRQYNALSLSYPKQFDASGGVTYSTTTLSGSATTGTTASTLNSTFGNSLITAIIPFISGSRMDIFPFATSLPAGQYWFACMFSSSTSTTGTGNTQGTAFTTHSRVHMLQFVDQAYKQLGTSVSNSSTDVEQFHGSLATTATSATAALGTVDLRNFLTNHRVYWNYAQSSY